MINMHMRTYVRLYMNVGPIHTTLKLGIENKCLCKNIQNMDFISVRGKDTNDYEIWLERQTPP